MYVQLRIPDDETIVTVSKGNFAKHPHSACGAESRDVVQSHRHDGNDYLS